MQWRIEPAGVSITVAAESSAAEGMVQIALSMMASSRVPDQAATHLTVGGRKNAWTLTDHTTGKTRSPNTAGGLIYQLTDRIIHHVAWSATRHHCLHASAVALDGVAVIMPGGSGAGKSLFTAWMVAHGFDYITDELILIDGAFRIGGISRPIQIKKSGLPAANGLVSDEREIIRGIRSNTIPIDILGGRRSPVQSHALGLVIFPEFEAGSAYALRRISAADSGMRLVSTNINARNLSKHGFPPLMEMVRNTPCYALKYSGFDDLPGTFAADLQSMLAQA